MKKLLFLCLILGFGHWVQATTYTVTNPSDPIPAVNTSTLRGAINAASSGDIITFVPNLHIKLNDQIVINKELTIVGARNTIIDGQSQHRIFETNQALICNGIIFQNGQDSPNHPGGGAILSSNASLTLNSCIFKNNRSDYQSGGAVFWFSLNNTTDEFYCSNTTFSKNVSSVLGGTLNLTLLTSSSGKRKATIINSKFIENETTGITDGGALVSIGCELSIQNCQFLKNSARTGGAMVLSGTEAFLTNTEILNNQASENGGGISLIASLITLTNTTVAGNTASQQGGGIFHFAPQFSRITLQNSIVAKNQANLLYHDISSSSSAFYSYLHGGNLIGIGSGFTSTMGNNLVGNSSLPLDPKFIDLSNGNTRLLPSSIAIDLGDVSLIPTDIYDLDNDSDILEAIDVDLGYSPRVVHASVDAGAYEYGCSLNGNLNASISTQSSGSGINYQVHALVANVSNGSGNYTYQWIEDGDVLSTSYRLEDPCSRRNYTLIVIDQVCGYTQTLSYSFSNTRNECADATPIDTHFPLGLSIFPNPSTSSTYIRSATSEIVSYAIYSTYGELIELKELKSPTASLEIDLSGQKVGMYILKVIDCEERVWQKRLVVER